MSGKEQSIICICPECDCEQVVNLAGDMTDDVTCHSCGHTMTQSEWADYETDLEP